MENIIHTIFLVIHVLGASLVFGVIFVSVIIELKKINSDQMLLLTELIWKIANIGLGLQLLTGGYLLGTEWKEFITNPYFWIKMVLFVIGGVVVGSMNKRKYLQLKTGESEERENIKGALLGLVLFILIITCGVIIAEHTGEDEMIDESSNLTQEVFSNLI